MGQEKTAEKKAHSPEHKYTVRVSGLQDSRLKRVQDDYVEMGMKKSPADIFREAFHFWYKHIYNSAPPQTPSPPQRMTFGTKKK